MTIYVNIAIALVHSDQHSESLCL